MLERIDDGRLLQARCTPPPWSRCTTTTRSGSCSATRARRSTRAATCTAASTTSTGCPTRGSRSTTARRGSSSSKGADATTETIMAAEMSMDTETAGIGHRRSPRPRPSSIIGSGAGGGTVAYELDHRAGSRASCWRPGPYLTADDYDNDEWAAFSQMAWLDMRTTSGSWRVARDFPNLPAWIVKAVGGSTTHWSRRDPAVHGPRVHGPGPLRRASTAPTCWTGRSPWTTWRPTTTRPRTRSARPTGTAGRRCRPTTTTRCSPTAPSGSATSYYATGPYGTNAEPYDGRPASIQDGFNFQGDKNRLQVVDRWSGRSRGRWPPASSTCGRSSQAVQITHDAQRHGRRRRVPRRGRQPAPAGGQGGLRGRQLDRVAAAAADERELAAPGRAGELLRPGRPQLHAAHDRLGLRAASSKPVHMYRGETMAGIIADEARHDTSPRVRRRLLHGDPLARAGLPGQRSSSRASGAAASPR